MSSKEHLTICKNQFFLFVGIDWKRKGGDFALNVFQKIRNEYPKATLQIVGCDPSEARGIPNVIIHGLLRKSIPAERDKIDELFASANFFITPSSHEAFGVVFSEAAAYGLPVIARRTGGVPTVVLDGKTGILLEPDDSAHNMADAVISLWRDTERYKMMRRNAKQHYETSLTWSVWRTSVSELLHKVADTEFQERAGRDS